MVSFGAPFDEVFEYAADVAPITLDLGVTYWISIFNNSTGGGTWFWAVAGLGNLHFRNDFFPDWRTHDFADSNVGFRLAQVPEPPTLLLLLAGTIGWFGARGSALRRRAG